MDTILQAGAGGIGSLVAVTLEVIAYDVLGQRASAQRFTMKDLRRR